MDWGLCCVFLVCVMCFLVGGIMNAYERNKRLARRLRRCERKLQEAERYLG